MTAARLLADLYRRGMRLTPNGDKLRIEPASLLTDADRAAIRIYRGELLARLRTPAPTDDFGLCQICGGDPAGMIVPEKDGIHGATRFCGIRCYQTARDARVQ